MPVIRPALTPVISRWFYTLIAMLAFAANSLLCREALSSAQIDAASFTAVRIASGAAMLSVLVLYRQRGQLALLYTSGSWWGAAALVGYAASFSWAYNSLSAATGALILFGMVQVSMIAYGLIKGERIQLWQWLGVITACSGLIWLMLPSVQSPPLVGALLMAFSGVCWGVYSLLGRGAGNPTAVSAGHFMRALPLALLLIAYVLLHPVLSLHASGLGYVYAIASGALASGLGYALWYSVLPSWSAASSAIIQLSVPVLSALGGVVLLDEQLSTRFISASVLVLAGIMLFLIKQRTAVSGKQSNN